MASHEQGFDNPYLTRLTATQRRQILSGIFDSATRLSSDTKDFDWSYPTCATLLEQGLPDLGVEVIASPHEVSVTGLDCGTYAFRNEPWAQGGRLDTRELYSYPNFLLPAKGYRSVEDLSEADIIAYIKTRGLATGEQAVKHFGIVIEEGERVESKFGNGPVLRHAAGDVPYAYGDSYTLFSRTNHLDLTAA